MISQHNVIVPALIIVTIIMRQQGRPLNFLSIQTQEIHFFLLNDFTFLIIRKIIQKELECFPCCNRVLNFFCLNLRGRLGVREYVLFGDLSFELFFQGFQTLRILLLFPGLRLSSVVWLIINDKRSDIELPLGIVFISCTLLHLELLSVHSLIEIRLFMLTDIQEGTVFG